MSSSRVCVCSPDRLEAVSQVWEVTIHGMCYFASRGNFAAAVTNGRRRRRGGRPSLGKAGAARGHAIRRPCVETRSKTAVLLASSIKSVAVRCASTPDLL